MSCYDAVVTYYQHPTCGILYNPAVIAAKPNKPLLETYYRPTRIHGGISALIDLDDVKRSKVKVRAVVKSAAGAGVHVGTTALGFQCQCQSMSMKIF